MRTILIVIVVGVWGCGFLLCAGQAYLGLKCPLAVRAWEDGCGMVITEEVDYHVDVHFPLLLQTCSSSHIREGAWAVIELIPLYSDRNIHVTALYLMSM